MATTAKSIDAIVFTIDTKDVSPDLVKGKLTPKVNSGSTLTTADGGKVLIPGEPTTWTLNLTVLVNDGATEFLRAKCYTKAGTTVAYSAVLKSAGATTSTISGTCVLAPPEVPFGEPWGATQQTDLSFDATVSSWT